MGTPHPYSYRMKTNGSTHGQESGRLHSWEPGREYRVPEDVPDGEFRHLNPNDYEIEERTDAMSRGPTKNTAMSGKTTSMSGEDTGMDTEGSSPEEDSGPDEGDASGEGRASDDDEEGGLFEQDTPQWSRGKSHAAGYYFSLYGGERVENPDSRTGYDTVGRGKEQAQAEIDRRNEEGLTPSEVIE